MVYDREMGSMRVLLTSPLPRWYVLICKLLSSTLVSLLQVYCFLSITPLVGVKFPLLGYAAAAPALLLTGLLMGAVGLFLSSLIRQLENFAGVMNFVIFPVFFLSSALYPLWKMQESSEFLYSLCSLNPFTYAVELIRFSLYCKWNGEALGLVVVSLALFWALSVIGYDPKRGLIHRQTG